MHALVDSTTCLMQAVVGELDDADSAPCGRCAVCDPPGLEATVDPSVVSEATGFLRRAAVEIEPRQRWAATPTTRATAIPAGLRAEPGRALSFWGDGGWGGRVREARREDLPFDDELADAVAALVRRWGPLPAPRWVTSVPTSSEPDHVASLARRVAERLELPYEDVLVRRAGHPRQRERPGPAAQMLNARDGLRARGGAAARAGPAARRRRRVALDADGVRGPAARRRRGLGAPAGAGPGDAGQRRVSHFPRDVPLVGRRVARGEVASYRRTARGRAAPRSVPETYCFSQTR